MIDFNCLAHWRIRRSTIILPLVAVFLVLQPSLAHGVEKPEEVINSRVGIFTQLGQQVDLSREFTDSSGRTGSLRDFAVPGKPIIIAPVYYRCPRLCGLLLDGVYALLSSLPLSLSRDYSLLVVGFNPIETPQDAQKVMDKFNSRLSGEETRDRRGLKFLVGSEQNVAAIMSEIGFRYMKDGDDFAHSAAVMILTPSGEI